MKKISCIRHIFSVRIFLFAFPVMIFFSGLQVFGSEDKTGQLTVRDVALLDFMVAARVFQAEASTDIYKAIGRFGTDILKAKWNTEIRPDFKDDDLLWPDFFSTSVIMGGRVGTDQATMAFYNPWHDAIMLTLWQGDEFDRKMADYLVLTGETWRGGKPNDNLWEPGWFNRTEGMSIDIGRIYKDTAECFSRDYPVFWTPEFLGPRLRSYGLNEERREQELTFVMARMLQRLYMYEAYLSGEDPEKSAVFSIVKTISGLVGWGDRESLLKIFPESSEDIELILQLHEDIRKTLYPSLLLSTDESAIAALVSPHCTKIYIFLYLKNGDPTDNVQGIQIGSFEVFQEF